MSKRIYHLNQAANAASYVESCWLAPNGSLGYDFEGFESVRPDTDSRDVAQQTPVISSEILTRIQTRSQGPAQDLPNVMLRPLEHEKANPESQSSAL